MKPLVVISPKIAFIIKIYMRQKAKLVYRKRDIGTDFVDFRTHMSQSAEKYLDVVGSWLIVRLKADDLYF